MMRIFYTVVCSTVLGYVMYLLFEALFINVGKSMFAKKAHLQTHKSPEIDAGINENRLNEDNNAYKKNSGNEDKNCDIKFRRRVIDITGGA